LDPDPATSMLQFVTVCLLPRPYNETLKKCIADYCRKYKLCLSVVRGTDPRIRIRTDMSRIPNTVSYLYEFLLKMEGDLSLGMERYTAGLGLLVPLLQSEPKGRR
jgi:hypothetical protein